MATGTTFGDRQELQGGQEVVPMADNRSLPEVGGGGPVPDPGSPPPDLLSALAGEPFRPIGLDGPAPDPSQPLTAGLPVGPGPGPDGQMRRALRDNVTSMLEELAFDSGDPRLVAMADRARSLQARSR